MGGKALWTAQAECRHPSGPGRQHDPVPCKRVVGALDDAAVTVVATGVTVTVKAVGAVAGAVLPDWRGKSVPANPISRRQLLGLWRWFALIRTILAVYLPIIRATFV